MTQAAQSGASFGNQLQSSLSKAGFTGEGAGSPIASFSQAAGGEAANSMQRGVRAGMYSDALNAVTNNMGQRMQAWTGSQMQQQATPTFGQQMGSALLGAGAQLATQAFQPKPGVAPQSAGAVAPAGAGSMSTVSPGYFGQAGMQTRSNRRGYGKSGLGQRMQ
jgi:hypothetical protein